LNDQIYMKKILNVLTISSMGIVIATPPGRLTDPPPAPLRQVAEFERARGVLIAYPFGIPVEMIQIMSEDVVIYCLVSTGMQSSAQSTMATAGVNMENVDFVIGNIDSYWTQDYGPYFVVDANYEMVIVDFEYNRPRPYDNQAPYKMSEHLGIPLFDSDVVHNGGNLMFDGFFTGASSTIVYVENGGINVDQRMFDFFGAQHYMTTPDPTGNYHQHINCWAKFLSPEKIMIIQVSPMHPYYQEIEDTAEFFAGQPDCFGEPYKIYRIYTPADEPYVNSFILNDKIYVPTGFGQWDDNAIQSFQDALPGYEIIGVPGPYMDPWLPTDGLHCRVLAIPDLQMLQILHNPLNDQEFPLENYPVVAIVDDLSQTGVIPESVIIHWKNTLSEEYENILMVQSELENEFIAVIPDQPIDTEIRYFITASDNSGRNERLPLAGYFSFSAIGGTPMETGDVNLDDSLNVLDIILIVNHITNESHLSGYALYLANLNDDGLVNILDVIVLINLILNQ